jgi:hypothetical protein
MLPRFEHFIRECKYLKNVSPAQSNGKNRALRGFRWSSPQPKTCVNLWGECQLMQLPHPGYKRFAWVD